MQKYSAGFAFSQNRKQVLLIKKNKPAWQAGKYNGVGGKIEPGESALEAMIREFNEEAGLHVPQWEEVVVLHGNDWSVHFFRSFNVDLGRCRSVTDELVSVQNVFDIPNLPVMPNLRWLVPICLDQALVTPIVVLDRIAQ